MTGHAWPLTQHDAKTRGRKTNCANTYTLPTGVQRARALFGIVELTRPPSGGSRGQLRLSLTNTYHEWPVKWRYRRSVMPVAESCLRLRGIPDQSLSACQLCSPRFDAISAVRRTSGRMLNISPSDETMAAAAGDRGNSRRSTGRNGPV